MFLSSQVETHYSKTKSRQVHTLAFRDNINADIRRTDRKDLLNLSYEGIENYFSYRCPKIF